jgi:hypothetical protein
VPVWNLIISWTYRRENCIKKIKISAADMNARFAADPNLAQQNDILIAELVSCSFLNISLAKLDLIM